MTVLNDDELLAQLALALATTPIAPSARDEAALRAVVDSTTVATPARPRRVPRWAVMAAAGAIALGGPIAAAAAMGPDAPAPIAALRRLLHLTVHQEPAAPTDTTPADSPPGSTPPPASSGEPAAPTTRAAPSTPTLPPVGTVAVGPPRPTGSGGGATVDDSSGSGGSVDDGRVDSGRVAGDAQAEPGAVGSDPGPPDSSSFNGSDPDGSSSDTHASSPASGGSGSLD